MIDLRPRMRCPGCRATVIEGNFWGGICERCYVTQTGLRVGQTDLSAWRAMLTRRYVRVIEAKLSRDVAFQGDEYMAVSAMVLGQLERNRGFYRRHPGQYISPWPADRKGEPVELDDEQIPARAS